MEVIFSKREINLQHIYKISQRYLNMQEKEDVPVQQSELAQQANISLTLEDYGDIFSDFDRRPFSVRALSVDFLEEAKRAARDKKEGFELNLLVPEKERDFRAESTIKARLKTHFARHFIMIKKENSQITKKGLLLTLTGIIIMLFAGYIILTLPEDARWTTLLLILFEPAGWFFFWEGLDLVIFKPREIHRELEFYRKLSRAEIKFISYPA